VHAGAEAQARGYLAAIIVAKPALAATLRAFAVTQVVDRFGVVAV
jgi:hypothetical protein